MKSLIAAIPVDSGLVFVVMQHLDPDRKSLMLEIAGHWTTLPVVAMHQKEKLLQNQVYLVPPGHLVTFTPLGVRLERLDPARRHFSPIDVMLRSLAAQLGARSIGVILSGSGRDGAAGLKAIRDKGGVGVVQEPDSATFAAMPLAALESAGADLVLPPAEIPKAVMDLLARTPERSEANSLPHPPTPSHNPDALLQTIIELAGTRKGCVLQGYKKSTLQRRVERRMQIKNLPTITDYLQLLQQQPEELDGLIQDILVGVTAFFRDSNAYHVLEQQVIPRLFADKNPAQPVRVWVAGCATGEEAYSIAMLLHEFREQAELMTHPIQIFATDLDDMALEEARAGRYREEGVREIEPHRLARFFTRQEPFFRINREVRESVVFASHNLLSDPPFSRIDLVVCRNVFIYLEQDAQSNLLSVFRFILNPDGYLFMGSSESLGQQEMHFEAVSKTWRIYRHQGKTPNRRDIPLLTGNPLQRLSAISSLSMAAVASTERLHRSILANHGPAMVLTSLEGESIYVTGNTQKFLMVPHGEPQHHIYGMIKPEVRTLLPAAMDRAVHDNQMATACTHPDESGLATRVTVTPIPSRQGDRLLLITLASEPAESAHVPHLSGEGFLIKQLELELQATRDDLQRTIEQLRSSNEELMAFNEETIAMNEELQSANEELESSKEEQQSLNEELSIANTTLDAKVTELEVINDDLSNLFSSTDTAILFLDRQLRIKRFTPTATRLMRLIPGDVGRPMTDIAHNLTGIDPLADAGRVLAEAVAMEREVRNQDGHWFLMRTMPYRTAQQQMDGLVITFTDVTVLKEAEARDHATMIFLEDQARLLSRAHLLVCDLDHRIVLWNAGMEAIYGWRGDEAVGRIFHELLQTEFPHPLPEIMAELRRCGQWQGDLVHHTRDRQAVTIFSHWRLTPEGECRIPAIVQVNNDTTELRSMASQLRQAKEAAEAASQAKSNFLANVSHEIRTPMNVVLGMSELLLESDLLAGQHRLAKMIYDSGMTLMRVINDLLDFSRIEAGRIELVEEPFSPGRMVEETMAWMRLVAEEKGLCLEEEVTATVPEAVLGDEGRLRQIVINLLSNAIKFTRQGKVRLSLELTAPDTLLFAVVDTGIGIAPEMTEQIFEQFTQADAGIARSYGGSGLGLAIVRHLVKLMGGRIWVESRLGQGSRFAFTLPVKLADAARLEGTPAVALPPSLVRGLRILLAEDVKENQELFAAYLANTPHRVVMAGNGMEAVARVREGSFDVVIMDVQMPEMDGYTATRLIRRWEQESGQAPVPIVALSAHAMEGETERSREAGCDSYESKPINKKRLLEILNQVSVLRETE
ncbi:MAG: PAS domain-containing protein [Magnetococcales bacterium]|nr:PAS domain-containing protein [Magnetococcales bacterium]